MNTKLALGLLALATVGSTSFDAKASPQTPLSAIKTLPALSPIRAATPVAVTVPGLTMKVQDQKNGVKWHDITAATSRGYCFAMTEGGFRFADSTGMSSRSERDEIDLDRLFEKDGKTMFERTRVALDGATSTVTAVGRATVELQEIARGPEGIVVWAYRWGSDLVVLTKRVERGAESASRTTEDGVSMPFVSVDGCPYAGARLETKKPDVGAYAQLAGSLPAKGTGKEKVIPKFLVDTSFAKVARDPEPMISVRVRVRE